MDPIEIESKQMAPLPFAGLVVGIVVLLLLVGLGSGVITLKQTEQWREAEQRSFILKWQKDAIEHGNAEYNSQTGLWQWIDHKKEKP